MFDDNASVSEIDDLINKLKKPRRNWNEAWFNNINWGKIASVIVIALGGTLFVLSMTLMIMSMWNMIRLM